ncbi:protocadherin gamma-B4-like [Tubulanus polymorphus]|uniref:protocadherin gamma-B4-like n=1 Tax=Tubulanus polymorphus TaxID=672921 RepID=UPI003DA53FF8
MSYFGINAVTGDVFIKKGLVADAPTATYSMRVKATDSGTPPLSSTECTFTVSVIRNDFAPGFGGPYSRSIDRNVQAPYPVLVVRATDQDGTVNDYGLVRYRLLGDSMAQNYFSVNPTSGQITMTQSVNTATVNTFRLMIEAYDDGVPAKRALVIVPITINRNLDAPTFGNQRFLTISIPETFQLGQTIKQMVATDADPQAPNNVVRYSVTGQADALPFFDILPDSGDVYAKKSLTTAPRDQYIVQVKAQDQGTPSLADPQLGQLTVTILRNRNAPVFTPQNYIIAIPESTLTTAPPIFKFGATDADLAVYAPFGTVKFQAIGDGTATSHFAVDANTGDVTVIGDLSIIPTTQFVMRVVASDGGSPAKTATQLLTININRNTNKPRFINPAGPTFTDTANINENDPMTKQVYKVTATDADRFVSKNLFISKTKTFTEFR